MRLRRNTVRKVVAMVLVSSFLAGYTHFKFKVDEVKEEFARGMEVLHQCGRLRLTMSRDDVIQLMGQPMKEYGVRPGGKNTNVLYTEMLFNVPLARQPAYVDLELETARVVEIKRKSTRLNSSHSDRSRMPSSA